nr:MAG TPA: hypothetical protein [Caudoviricetes sp.]
MLNIFLPMAMSLQHLAKHRCYGNHIMPALQLL